MKRYIPFLISLGLFLIVTGVILFISLKNNEGHLIYALDDPYIHMAMAKNFSRYGIWGVDKTSFSSSSSSPLWTLLISCGFFVFGVNEILPFIMNIIFSIVLLFTVNYQLRKSGLTNIYISIVCICIVVMTPLYSLAFAGLEHVLHILLITLFFFFVKDVILEKKNIAWTIILAMFAIGARYESLFAVFFLMLILFLKKRYAAAVLLLMFSVLPVVSYGFVSIANGWSFFPNPLLLKGNFSGLSFKEFSKLFNRFVEQAFKTPHLAVLVISALILYLFSKKLKASKNAIILPFFIGTTLFHLIFARVGWFFRYEAYLIVIGLLVVSVIAYEMFPESEKWWNNLSWAKKIFFIFSILLFYAPLVSRVYLGFATTQKATKNIYEQQYQMGLFIQKFYTGESVMLNDIGAVCFLADIKCVDVWGIANHDVMRLKRSESYYPHDFEMIAVEKGCKLGIIYEDWLRFYGELPSKWIKVGVWKIKDNVVAARDEVTFFAFDSLEAYKLRENLSVFRNKLPKDVEQVLY